MVCLALEKYVWEQLHLEPLAAKERREAAESSQAPGQRDDFLPS